MYVYIYICIFMYGGSEHNKYCDDKTCYIVIYYGVLCYISILCLNMICVRLQ